MEKNSTHKNEKDATGIQKMDRLIHLSSELVTLRAQFSRIGGSFEEALSGTIDRGVLLQRVRKLDELTRNFSKVASDIQSQVMHVKMMPLRTFFASIEEEMQHRLKMSDSSVLLHFESGGEEMDRAILDVLRRPLEMLINTVVFNAENAGERTSHGIQGRGVVSVNATRHGNTICIEITHDDHGVVPDEDSRLQDIFNDVRETVESIQGKLEGAAECGGGSCVRMQIPLSLAITKALMVVINEQTYAIPAESIVEILKVRGDELYSVEGNRTVKLRGVALSLVDLRDIIHIKRGKEKSETDSIKVVAITNGVAQVGVIADDIIGENDVVIKQLSGYFKNVQGINGISVLEDGKVALVIDPLGLIALAI